jgi:hypothetical protein
MMEERSEQEQQKQRYQGQTAPEQAQAKHEKKPHAGDGGLRYCKYCGKPLAAGQAFCPDCGEKYGGEEHICQCGAITTKKNCPKCGCLLVPYTCPKCGKTSFSPICSCGAILDKKIQAMQAAQAKTEEAPPPAFRQMSEEEVRKIEERFHAEEENLDFKKFQKRLLEREKLLEERDYYNKMQKEIIEVFGERPFKLELPDPEEQAARMRIYASLERTIIEKQCHATQAELEALYPELRDVHQVKNKAAQEKAAAEEADRNRRLEQIRREKAMEEKYRAILEGVEREIQEAKDGARQAEETKKEEEKKRLLALMAEEEAQLKREREEAEAKATAKAERRARIAAEEKAAAEAKAKAVAAAAQRQREMQEAREHAERQAYINRIVGTYYYEGNNEKLCIVFNSLTHAYCNDIFSAKPVYSECAVTMQGNHVTLRETANPGNYPMKDHFEGDLNSSGTTLIGNWYDGSKQSKLYTYYKVR